MAFDKSFGRSWFYKRNLLAFADVPDVQCYGRERERSRKRRQSGWIQDLKTKLMKINIQDHKVPKLKEKKQRRNSRVHLPW